MPPPETKVQISLTSGNVDLELAEGDELPQEIAGTWSATDLPSANSVYLQITDASSRFQMPAPQLATAGTAFTFNLQTAADVPAGTYEGTLNVRACRDSACAQTYAGTSGSISYALRVAAVADWETHQRDAGHTGYVPIWLNASKFAEAWRWQRPPDGEPIGGINAVVTGKGVVYLSKDVYFGEGALIALNEQDGLEAWRVSFGTVPALGPPAVKGDNIFVATTGHQDTFLWRFNAGTGGFRSKSAFSGQWPHTLNPTVFDDRVYVGAGYYGGVAYSFSTLDGAAVWQYASGGVWDMFTPAVNENFVYHYDGGTLHLVDKETGVAAHTIADPFGGGSSGYSYHGSPILGSRSNVLAYAGGAFSGRASSNVEQYDQRVLSSFDVSANMRYEWSTSYAYLTAPAVAHGQIYVARNSPMSLDAIDETTGQIVWSWRPEGQGDSSFHRNIVVTRNLLFVSTDAAVYAIDLQTRAVRWRHPQPGMLALSADRTLYIATGARESNGGLVAIRLQ
ncbi:PQQ-binding-like beta-propeller repeat protein [Steroidobacter cummioxidans]|uniref:outer membrane protein assembly factor BamB family protein n=1 Tax=Steroidobacter cummioxidans TaxID=1803913 RepID=UPI0012901C8A|nr:PQQ-binding-like beta-propeller repeat protein [Steroidobacter cummioxidans]